MKKVLMLIAALLFASSMAFADGHGKAMDKGSETGVMMKKSGNSMKSGSCGAGKCGGDMKKGEMKSGSCGAGKCGGDMGKKDKKPKKPSGSCGAGK